MNVTPNAIPYAELTTRQTVTGTGILVTVWNVPGMRDKRTGRTRATRTVQSKAAATRWARQVAGPDVEVHDLTGF